MHVTVRPRARETRVGGTSADGRLAVSVRSAPREGEANEDVMRALAAAFDVPRGSVRLTRGVSARRKTLEIAGARPERLEELMRGHDTR